MTEKYIPRFNVNSNRPYFNEANGGYINNYYFDATCAAGTLIFGYTPKIFQKLKEENYFMFSTLRFNHIKLDEYADLIKRRSLVDVHYTGNTGSDAVEAAIKASWDNTKKTKIIARDGAFHGSTIRSNGLGNYISWKQYESLFPKNQIRIPYNSSINTMSELCEYELDFIKRQQDIGAIILEPFPSIVYGCKYEFDDSGCYNKLRDFCDENNISLIFDEVYTGAGKTGKFLFTEYLDIDPDILCLAKGITAGLVPLSLIITKKDYLKGFKYGITHAGHYLGVSAAILVYYELEEMYSSIKNKSKIYNKYFDNNMGLLFGLTTDNYNESEKVFVNKSPYANYISFAPPLNSTENDFEFCINEIIRNKNE